MTRNWPSGEADGSLEAGHSKSSLLRLQSNSSLGNASNLVTKVLWSKQFMRLLVFRRQHFKETPYPSLASMSDYRG